MRKSASCDDQKVPCGHGKTSGKLRKLKRRRGPAAIRVEKQRIRWFIIVVTLRPIGRLGACAKAASLQFGCGKTQPGKDLARQPYPLDARGHIGDRINAAQSTCAGKHRGIFVVATCRLVGPVAARQGVAPFTTVQNIVARAPSQIIVPAHAKQAIAQFAADQRIVKVRAPGVFDGHKHIAWPPVPPEARFKATPKPGRQLAQSGPLLRYSPPESEGLHK